MLVEVDPPGPVTVSVTVTGLMSVEYVWVGGGLPLSVDPSPHAQSHVSITPVEESTEHVSTRPVLGMQLNAAVGGAGVGVGAGVGLGVGVGGGL